MLLNNYIDTVGPDDHCFFLGDLTIKRNSKDKPWLASVFSQLPGKKHLVKGNHDQYTTKFYKEECGFLSAKRYIQTEGIDMVHNPADFKEHVYLSNLLLLHGHVHSNYPAMEFGIWVLNESRVYDVGVDANNFKPVSLKYIKEFFKGPYVRLKKEFAYSQSRA